MQIVSKEADMRHYLKTAVEVDEDKPVLVISTYAVKNSRSMPYVTVAMCLFPVSWNLLRGPVCIRVTQ